MPRFLLPILVLALISLAGFGFVVLKLSPEQTSSVVLFLTTLFLSLVFALSLVFFFVRRRFFSRPRPQAVLGPVVIVDDLRPLFRTSFLRALLVSIITIALVVLWKLG